MRLCGIWNDGQKEAFDKMSCQGRFASGPNKGHPCRNPAIYPLGSPHFCGKHIRGATAVAAPATRSAAEEPPPALAALKFHMQESNKIGYHVECGGAFALLSVRRNDLPVRGALESAFPARTGSGDARLFQAALQNESLRVEGVKDFAWLGYLLFACLRSPVPGWDTRRDHPGKTDAEIGFAEYNVSFYRARHRYSIMDCDLHFWRHAAVNGAELVASHGPATPTCAAEPLRRVPTE